MIRASVILPVYNGEKLVERAIRSLTSAPPSFDYEILAVDDGSTDATPALLSRLAEEVPSLRVLRQENAGPAAARNLGLEEARGEWILFCDCDDAFAPGALEEAVALAQGQDLLIFGYTLVQEGERRPYAYPECTLSRPRDWEEHLAPLYGANMLNQVWGKVFSAKLLRENGIRFPDLFWGEDRLFFFRVLEKAARVKVTERCFYEYIQQKNSLISRHIPEKPGICRQINEEIRALAKEKCAGSGTGAEVYSYMYLKSLLSCLSNLYSPGCTLSHREKRGYAKLVLSQPGVAPAKDDPPGCGVPFRVLAAVFRGGNITLNLLAAWGVTKASRLSPTLFRRAKHAYNNDRKEKKT